MSVALTGVEGMPAAPAAGISRVVTSVALPVTGVALLLTGTGLVLGLGGGQSPDEFVHLVFVAACLVTGGLIAHRRPDNRVGLALLGCGVCFALAEALGQTALRFPEGSPAAAVLGWPQTWLWVPGNLLLALTPVLFPDGRAAPGWRRPLRGLAVIAAGTAVLSALRPGRDEQLGLPGRPNPLGVPGLGPAADVAAAAFTLSAGLVVVVAGARLLLRVRQLPPGSRLRLQVEWPAFALGLCALAVLTRLVVGLTDGDRGGVWPAQAPAWDALGSLTTALVPVALAVAVIRHQLFDIERLIGRTVLLVVLTGAVVAVYLALVAAAGGLLGETARATGPRAGGGGRRTRARAAARCPAASCRQAALRRSRRPLHGAGPSRPAAGGGRGRDVRLRGRRHRARRPAPRRGGRRRRRWRADRRRSAARHPRRDPADRRRGTGGPVAAGPAAGRDRAGRARPRAAPRPGPERGRRGPRRPGGPACRAAGSGPAGVPGAAGPGQGGGAPAAPPRRPRRAGPAPRRPGHASGDRARGRDPAVARALLDEVADDARTALADVRRLVDGLRPPALDTLGLVGALEAHLAGRPPPAVPVVLDVVRPLPPLPAAVEVAAYRIAVEAVANVDRHAAAGTAVVRLFPDGDLLHLEVSDDGRGGAKPALGVGLASMRERAAELGGRCTITSDGGRGTVVRADLPLDRHRSEGDDGADPRPAG
ncbi:sensor histidine kinase [Blastococcus sp. CCUG 61487]|uniref:sensor histidine kinase n=1 Tax=Blastococcus sp. CCUG 61487 TaxID=1840703 RepID=UPI0010C098CB|nr:sensor histidine kinase [Blastococcus sp. CCUG 61487]TKJ30538.1 hypothetical protein A6V29_18820 [Blastococcus sp. CCUG 61487]